MTINDLILTSLAEAELNTYAWKQLRLSKDQAIDFLKTEIKEEFEDLQSLETMKARFNYFKIPGTTPASFNENILDLGNNLYLIHGIRHMGGNKNLPFINIKTNFDFHNLKEKELILAELKEKYKIFTPLYYSYHHSKPLDCDLKGSAHLVSTKKEIIQKSPWTGQEDLNFQTPNLDNYYKWYSEGYENFHRSSPNLKSKVTVNSKDLMDESLEQGLLQFVLYKGERIGLIAAERSDFLGHPGIYFNEIFIAKNWKGKGFAKKIQRKFIEEYAKENDFIWGTIDQENLPSLQTAKSNGRAPVRYECYFSIS